MEFKDIQKLVTVYARAQEALADVVRAMQEKVQGVQRNYLIQIRAAALRAGEKAVVLKDAILAAPELFEKPRTYVVEGVKFGLQKAKGRLEWPDDAALVEKINVVYGANANGLLRTVVKPDAKALEQLSAKELKALGVEVVADHDEVVLKSAAAEVDKVVAALMKEMEGKS